MKLAVFFAALFTGLCFAADAKEDAVKKELEKLQGTWKVVKAIKEGRAKSDDELKEMHAVITADKLTVKLTVKASEDLSETTPFTIDPSKQPTTIDLTIGKRTLQGIYELDKDTLKICVSLEEDKRPTEFTSTDKSRTSLLILQREKK
jgi:uncharacterized protein (TIGR03067 family)